MSGTDVPPSSVFEQAMVLAVQRMTGAQLAKVESYNAATQRATVTTLVPILVARDGSDPAADVVDPVVTLPDVPVEWPSSHNAAGVLQHSIKFPLPAGSWVSVEPKGHDHSQWFTSGSPGVTPSDTRRFSIADMVVRPLAPVPLAKQPVEPLSYDAAGAVLFGLWIVGGSDATEFVALASQVVTELQNIRNFFDAHVHPAGTPNTGVPTLLFSTAPSPPGPGPVGSCAATKLKAK